MSQSYRYDLSVAGLGLRFESDRPIGMEDRFRPFLRSHGSPNLTLRFTEVDRLPDLPEQLIHEDVCYRIHPDGHGGFLRSFFDAPRDLTPYALARREGDVCTVAYLEKGAHCISSMGNSFFHLGLEEQLLRHDRLCLHASCIRAEAGGILFSGPSGIGKSTQAELWCRFRDARQINGDRPILSKDGSGWLAWGSPYAGSSRCYVNDSCPVSAIVMLRQGPRCALRRLRTAEAFRAVWSGLTMNSWDPSQVCSATDLTLELIAAVPVFEFTCTPDEEAVRYLERALREEDAL